MLPCLTLSIIRYVSGVKWSNPRKGVAPSPILRCSSYWKGSLLITLDYGRKLCSIDIVAVTLLQWACCKNLIRQSFEVISILGNFSLLAIRHIHTSEIFVTLFVVHSSWIILTIKLIRLLFWIFKIFTVGIQTHSSWNPFFFVVLFMVVLGLF